MQECLSRSFELIYHSYSSEFNGRTHFITREGSFSIDQRIQYLKHYVELNRSFHNVEKDFLATPIVSEGEINQVKTYLKDIPHPKIRHIIPLKYWKWKLEKIDSSREENWVRPDYDDYAWNELEVPMLICRNRDLYLRSWVKLRKINKVFLDIESIIDEYRIWVNGDFVYHHQGYEPTTIELTSFLSSNRDNLIAIKVTRKEDRKIGIAGEINLISTGKTFVKDLFVRTLEIKNGQALVKIEVDLKNDSSQNFKGHTNIEFTKWFPKEKGSSLFSADFPVKIPPGKTECIKKNCQIENPDVWFPYSPNLYKVSITLYNSDNHPVDDFVDTTGIRTIKQKNAKIYLNGERFFIKSFGNHLGFPPGSDSHGHICPPDEWLIRDMLLCKKANANTIRIHPWGYTRYTSGKGRYNEYGWPEFGDFDDATNYNRIAHLADQLGLCLIWGTRHWAFQQWGLRTNYDESRMEDLLVPSIKKVRNHPSIIIYEGLNEVGATLKYKDVPLFPLVKGLLEKEKILLRKYYIKSFKIFCEKYIKVVNSVDNSRLICPDSPWGPYFQQNKVLVHLDNPDIFLTENVFWDVHAYIGWYRDLEKMYDFDNIYWPKTKERPVLLTECGAEAMPNWSLYKGLPWYGVWLNNGIPCATIEKDRLGRSFNILRKSEVHLSQGYQGLCIQQTANFVRNTEADGMNINFIADGLSEGCYHKGTTDLYRKAKIGYFVTKMCYQDMLVTGMDGDFIFSKNDKLKLRLVQDKKLKEQKGTLRVVIKDMEGKIIEEINLDVKLGEVGVQQLREYKPNLPKEGFYQIEYIVERAKQRK